MDLCWHSDCVCGDGNYYAYLELFSLTSKHVREQVYSIDGIDYRNVIAGFGPDTGP